MIFDYVYIDQNGQLQYNKEEDFIIDHYEAEESLSEGSSPEQEAEQEAEWLTELEAERIRELDREIEEYMRRYADLARSSDETILDMTEL